MTVNALNNEETAVLELVKEYLSKKAFFSIKDIIIFVNNRLKTNQLINRNKIELILKSMIKKKQIVPGTKLMKSNITENMTRKKILNHIKKNPAININEIIKNQDVGTNQALWHLSALEKFQFIRSRKVGNRRIFFTYDSDPKLDKLYFFFKIEIVQEIIQFMRECEEPLKVTDIAEGLKKNHNIVKKYLNVLENLNMLIIQKEKTRNLYKIDQDKYEEAKNIVESSNN
ncbi:MAG: ArsR family transcriptional regulator [Candidatus Lokiarchaeota archaeon]|nr:ArsR family transcriptional regulator [Candidatus Lokiarchaeota archaeon]